MEEKSDIKIYALFAAVQNKGRQLNDVKKDIIKSKSEDIQNESDLWLHTDFKERKLTNQELRKAYVQSQLEKRYPSFTSTYIAQAQKIQLDIDNITLLLDFMVRNNMKKIPYEDVKWIVEDETLKDSIQWY